MNSLHSRSANSSGTSTVMDAAMAAMAPPSISTRSRTSTGEPLGGVSPLCRFLTTAAGAAISQIFAAPDAAEARRLYETLGPAPPERRVVPVQATRKEIALASP